MKLNLLFPAGAILAPVLLTLIGTSASAGPSADRTVATAAAAAPRGAPDFDVTAPWTGVLHDEPGDGRQWSMGATWKASFGPEGATYYPRAGSTEVRRLPHALSPDRVTIGGESIAFDRVAMPQRSGDRVELRRVAFTERYDLRPETIEQSFVFDALPRAGELELTIPVASELDAVETADGLEFRSDRGRITYSRAVVVDALGRRTPVGTRLVDGAISIRIGADVLAGAALPIVIDPVLGAIFPDLTTDDTFSLDTAFDPFQAVWVVVYERVFTATDHDVIAKMYSSTGSLLATGTVDVTGDSWVTPRIADLAPAHKFLVVAGSTAASGGARTARGRIMQPNGTLLTSDPQVSISGALTGDCILPDVGGHSDPNVPGTWCVAFERAISSSDHRIVYCLVSSAGTIAIGPLTMPFLVNTADSAPTVSKTNGGTAWTLAWVRSGFPQETIQAARISTVGGILAGPFFAGNGPFASSPCASGPIDGTELTAIVWQRGLPVGSLDAQVIVTLLDGGTVLQIEDLTLFEGFVPTAAHQTEPSVDSDGQHFLVAYSQFDAQFSHFKLYATDLAVAGTSLQVAQSHLELQPGLGLSQVRSNVAAARVPGTLAHRYLTVYDYRQNDLDHDAAGRFVDGVVGGPASRFCSGDGTGTACPCGNSGAAGQGCGNSVFSAGASLGLLAGGASTLADTAVLQVAGVPPGVSCLYFQGTTASVGAVFGDGLRCATGAVIRLATNTADAAGIGRCPAAGDPPISVEGGVPTSGGLRTYQVWYRNAASFCTSSTFNLSNGLAIQWAR